MPGKNIVESKPTANSSDYALQHSKVEILFRISPQTRSKD